MTHEADANGGKGQSVTLKTCSSWNSSKIKAPGVHFVNYAWDKGKLEPAAPNFLKCALRKLFAFSSPSWPRLWRNSCKGHTSGGSGLRWCGSLRLSLPTGEVAEHSILKTTPDCGLGFHFQPNKSFLLDKWDWPRCHFSWHQFYKQTEQFSVHHHFKANYKMTCKHLRESICLYSVVFIAALFFCLMGNITFPVMFHIFLVS